MRRAFEELEIKNMKPSWQKSFALMLGTMLLIQMVGCISKEKYYEQTSQAREESYQAWKNRKERPQESGVLISGKLSIEDCLKLTLVNNKTLQRVLEEKKIAKGEELKSYSVMLPTVSLTGGYTRKDQVASLGSISFGSLNNYSVGLSISQPLFAGGSIIATINSARLASLLTDQTIRTVFQDAIYTSNHLYYDVLLNQHLFEISADAVHSAQAHLDSVKQKRQAGVASDFDVLRAEVELSNFKAEHIQSKNDINIAKASLLKAMGVSQDSEITLSDELVYIPSDVNIEQAVETAYKNRPDLFGRQFDITLQKELLNIARSRYFPTINANHTDMWSNPDPHNSTKLQWGHAWQAGLSVTTLLFDGFAREGEVIQQKARLRQAHINLTDAEETALFELAKAQLGIENAAEFVESQKLNFTRWQESLRLAEVGYKEGVNTQVEIIDAQAALTKAKSFYYLAVYTHMIAKLDLQKAMGVLSPKLQDDATTKSDAEVQSTRTDDKEDDKIIEEDKIISQKADLLKEASVDGHTVGEPK